MMRFLHRFSMVTPLLFVTWCGAQTNDTVSMPAGTLEEPAPPRLNRIGLSYRMGLNISAKFKKLGGLQLSDPGPATGSTYNRTYDNGYNLVDSSGNNGGTTWNWGYQN